MRDDAEVLDLSERSVELPQSTGRDSKPNLHLNAADSRLAKVRCEFIDTLDDIPGRVADDAIAQIYAAASMHDLWHLRLDVFNLVSRHHDQAEADHRLSQLNRHFPTRSPRSGFGALNGR